MLKTFVNECVCDPVTCLGVTLRPFSIGHYWLLQRLDSPLFKPGHPIGFADLILAVLVCSNDFESGRTILARSDLDRELERWRKRISGNFFARPFLKKVSAARILNATKIFLEYLNAGVTSEPYVMFAPSSQDSTVRSDWTMMTFIALMRTFRMSFNDAVNMHLPLTRWMLAINGEREGGVKLADRDEQAALQKEADAIAREVFGEQKPNSQN